MSTSSIVKKEGGTLFSLPSVHAMCKFIKPKKAGEGRECVCLHPPIHAGWGSPTHQGQQRASPFRFICGRVSGFDHGCGAHLEEVIMGISKVIRVLKVNADLLLFWLESPYSEVSVFPVESSHWWVGVPWEVSKGGTPSAIHLPYLHNGPTSSFHVATGSWGRAMVLPLI